jgi:hypothetical protein
MNLEKNKIVSINIVEKRETEKISGRMEKSGFNTCLQELTQKNMIIKEKMTDEYTQISALLSKKLDTL